jgi:hypothetical protein
MLAKHWEFWRLFPVFCFVLGGTVVLKEETLLDKLWRIQLSLVAPLFEGHEN